VLFESVTIYGEIMAYTIGKKCLSEQYASCVAVCPVECIHPGNYKDKVFMIIDPQVCIDCGLCQAECPVDAILPTGSEESEWGKINAQLAPEFKKNPKVIPRDKKEPPKKPH